MMRALDARRLEPLAMSLATTPSCATGPVPVVLPGEPAASATVFGACPAKPDVVIPAMGLRLWVRLPPALFGGAASVIETAHAPGAGPPLHRHRETEVFRVLRGRYLMQVAQRQFEIGEGEIVHVPGGVAHAFVNIGSDEARQLVLITPGMQADVFFRELAQRMAEGSVTSAALRDFGQRWNIEFLGPPLRARAATGAPSTVAGGRQP